MLKSLHIWIHIQILSDGIEEFHLRDKQFQQCFLCCLCQHFNIFNSFILLFLSCACVNIFTTCKFCAFISVRPTVVQLVERFTTNPNNAIPAGSCLIPQYERIFFGPHLSTYHQWVAVLFRLSEIKVCEVGCSHMSGKL